MKKVLIMTIFICFLGVAVPSAYYVTCTGWFNPEGLYWQMSFKDFGINDASIDDIYRRTYNYLSFYDHFRLEIGYPGPDVILRCEGLECEPYRLRLYFELPPQEALCRFATSKPVRSYFIFDFDFEEQELTHYRFYPPAYVYSINDKIDRTPAKEFSYHIENEIYQFVGELQDEYEELPQKYYIRTYIKELFLDAHHFKFRNYSYSRY